LALAMICITIIISAVILGNAIHTEPAPVNPFDVPVMITQ
jgi:hypothetical protein